MAIEKAAVAVIPQKKTWPHFQYFQQNTAIFRNFLQEHDMENSETCIKHVKT